MGNKGCHMINGYIIQVTGSLGKGGFKDLGRMNYTKHVVAYCRFTLFKTVTFTS